MQWSVHQRPQDSHPPCWANDQRVAKVGELPGLHGLEFVPAGEARRRCEGEPNPAARFVGFDEIADGAVTALGARFETIVERHGRPDWRRPDPVRFGDPVDHLLSLEWVNLESPLMKVDVHWADISDYSLISLYPDPEGVSGSVPDDGTARDRRMEVMLKRILVRSVAVLVVIGLAGWLFVTAQGRNADSGPLVARLESLSVPAEFTFVEERSLDGDWLIKPRSAEASRTYLSAGSPDEICDRIDAFYTAAGIDIREVTSSRSDYDGCDRRLDGEIWIWVEPASEWMVEQYAIGAAGPMARIQYVAYGG